MGPPLRNKLIFSMSYGYQPFFCGITLFGHFLYLNAYVLIPALRSTGHFDAGCYQSGRQALNISRIVPK